MTLEVTVWSVFFYALLTALATGLGALPFLFVRDMSRKWMGVSNAIAGGLMLAASFGLIYEGVSYSLVRVLIGVLLGLLFILWSHRVVERYDHLKLTATLKGVDARKALLIIGIMTLHSAAEGIGVGVSFGGGETFGLFISLAIAVHNIPEGLAISLVLVPRGVPVWQAALWSIFTSLPQPLMAVPAFLFVEFFRPALPVGLGFAAGAMIWMVFSEIIPDALEDTTPNSVAVAVTLSVVAMIAFQIIFGG